MNGVDLSIPPTLAIAGSPMSLTATALHTLPALPQRPAALGVQVSWAEYLWS